MDSVRFEVRQMNEFCHSYIEFVYKKYSGCGFFDGMPRLSWAAASNMMKFRCSWSFSSRIAATFPHLRDNYNRNDEIACVYTKMEGLG